MKQDIKDFLISQSARRTGAKNIFYERKHWVELHVEDYDDIPFWYIVFKRYAPSLNLKFIPYTRREKHDGTQQYIRGKDILLKCVRETESKEDEDKFVNHDKLICVDSDYDHLLQDTPDALTISRNKPYIFQTYAYAIENYKCLAESLDGICVETTYHTELEFDFVEFLKEFSNKIYELFLYSIYSKKNQISNAITIDQFCQIIDLGGKHDVRNNANKVLQKLDKRIADKIKQIKEANPKMDFDKELTALADELQDRGVTRENTYLFIKGHTLFKAVVYPMIDSVVCRLIGNKYKQISDETSEDKETAHHLRTEYEKLIYELDREESLSESRGENVKSKKKNKEMIYHPRKLLNRNKEFFHYKCVVLNKIKEDIAEYLKRHPIS